MIREDTRLTALESGDSPFRYEGDVSGDFDWLRLHAPGSPRGSLEIISKSTGAVVAVLPAVHVANEGGSSLAVAGDCRIRYVSEEAFPEDSTIALEWRPADLSFERYADMSDMAPTALEDLEYLLDKDELFELYSDGTTHPFMCVCCKTRLKAGEPCHNHECPLSPSDDT